MNFLNLFFNKEVDKFENKFKFKTSYCIFFATKHYSIRTSISYNITQAQLLRRDFLISGFRNFFYELQTE
ncbi:MAG: hypothetical protein CMO01_09340 [Thalassobius sp.]|nr:hypothetical protein [Thalassovita sp.]